MKEEEEDKRREEDKRGKKRKGSGAGATEWEGAARAATQRDIRGTSSSCPTTRGEHVPRMGGAPRPQTMKSRYNYLPMYSMRLMT